MTELDKLSIKITSDASAANRSIEALAGKIERMSKALGSLDSGSISDFSKGLKTLTEALNSFGGSEKDAEKFKVMAKGIRSFTSINSGELKSIASAITPLANGISQVNSISFDGKSVTSFVNAITRLAKADAGALANVDFGAIGNKMKGFTEALSSAATIDSRTQSLINSITRLANAGDKSTTVSANLESLGARLKSAIEKIAGADVSKASQNTILLTQAIAQLANAGAKAETTASHLENLGEKTVAFIKKLEDAPQVSKNTSQLVTAIGNIAGAGSRANGAFNSIATSGTRNVSILSKLGNAFKKLIPGMNRANKSSKGLASTFGMFYAKFFLVIRAIKALGNAIGSAQDYIEEFNYFSVALDKIGRDSASQFREAGYNSAEEYARSFRGRFTKLQRQMTGYDVNTDTGELTGGLRKSLGLNISEVMNFQAAIAQITNSAGMLGETSIKTSKALSMLSADWSSLSNTDLSDVMNNMQSALIGQSRSVYKYGIDITAAGLAQTAMNHGLQVNVKNLSQASKMQLRLLTILEQSKVAYGDLSKTINQPANQLRMLRAGIQNLCREIAGLLLPVIQRVYPYLNAVVMVLQEFVEWIGKLTGANLKAVAGSMKTPDLGYEDAADDSGDMADNTKKAAKEAKKLSDNLQGFDIINKLDKKNDSDSGAGTSGLGGQNLDLSGDIDAALKNYEKIWNKAFKSNENKAARLAKKIKKALLSGWKKGDFTELGKKLAKWISDGLDKIPWAGIRKVTNKLAKSIATFLNGFLGDKKLWKKVATTLAKGFNTAVTSLYTFVTTLDWLKFGQNIAEGINTAIRKANFKKAGKTLGASLRGIIQTAFGALTNIEYATIGKQLGTFINGFLEDMGEVRQNTGLTGWQELGKSLSDGVKGLADTLIEALKSVNWSDVGKAIGEFLGSIDWFGIIGKALEILKVAIPKVIETVLNAIAADPGGVAEAAVTLFGAIFAYKRLSAATGGFKTSLTKVIGEGIKGTKFATKVAEWASLFKKTLVKAIAESKIGAAIGNAITGLQAAGAGVASKLSAAITAKLGSTAFVTSLASVLTAALAAAVSGVIIGKMINKAIDAHNGTGEFEFKIPENLQKSVEASRKSFEKTQKSVQDTTKWISNMNNAQKKIDGKEIGKLANEYFKLSKKAHPTASDIAVMKDYSEKLSGVIPGLSKSIDKQTGAFKGNKKQLNSMISGYKRAAKAQAAYNQAVKLYEKKSENEEAIRSKEKELKQYEKDYKVQMDMLKNIADLRGKDSESYRNQLRVAGRYAEKLNNARFEVEELKNSNKEISEQIKRNNKVMENAKISTGQYANAAAGLRDKMEKLGVKTKSQNNVMKDLQERLDNGEISWKAYKKLVDGSYNSTKELNKAIQKVSPKTVKVEAKTSGKKDVDATNKSIKGLKGKKVDVTANTKSADTELSSFASKYNEIRSTVKASMDKGSILGVSKAISNNFSDIKLGIKLNLEKLGFDGIKKLLKKGIPGVLELGKIALSPLAKGGLVYNPTAALIGEAGKEAVLPLTNRNAMKAVADGISENSTNGLSETMIKRMAEATYTAILSAMRDSGGDGSLVINLDGRKIAESTIGQINSMTRSRGVNPVLKYS